MKAVLVIDMPDMCLNCDLYAFQSCYPLQRRINRDGLKMVDKPEWCPLRPMPLKGTMENVVECEYNKGFVDGRNHCIDLIMGETE